MILSKSNFLSVLYTSLELTRLRDSFTMIQAVLADAERRQVREEPVRLWLLRLKDVAYDADEVLDEFAFNLIFHLIIATKERWVRPDFSVTTTKSWMRMSVMRSCITYKQYVNMIYPAWSIKQKCLLFFFFS